MRPALVGAVAAIGLATLSGCGGGRDGSGRLAWVGSPGLFHPQDLPRDSIVSGRVKNTGGGTLHLRSSHLRVLDGRGRSLETAATFTQTFAHRLTPYNQPGAPTRKEELRTGAIARIAPGNSVPLTVSWRLGPGTGRAARIDYGPGSLPVRSPWAPER